MAADWIQDLCRETGISHKEKILERALIASRLGSASAECFLYNTYLAYNPYYYYGVIYIPLSQNLRYKKNPWQRFWALTEHLRTGGFARKESTIFVQNLCNEFDSEQWNWVCRRVLLKDFKCGINIEIINKVLGKSEWRIPE